ncbi:MAG: thermonuclease family protein, partial [Myxococcota bacterium]
AVETPPARVDDAPPAPKRAAEAKDETPSLSATLMKVTDGDTIVVKLDGKRERVRLVGIDTPETANSPRGPQPYADEATAALERLLGRGRLALRFDAEERDHYGRLLAYVYASDGTFVNEAMVRDGWARALRVPPNVRHAKHFESLAREARRARRGIWAGG